jgi:thioredoxin-related protein
MKTLLIFLFAIAGFNAQPWQTDFEKARSVAKEQHKPILLYFSGSDWCGPCIRLRKEIFDSPEFVSMADSELVLVNADFPRGSKHQLAKSLQQQNDNLASQYNNEGKFPLTVLIDAKTGKKIKSWEGFPKEPATKFIGEIKQEADAISPH